MWKITFEVRSTDGPKGNLKRLPYPPIKHLFDHTNIPGHTPLFCIHFCNPAFLGMVYKCGELRVVALYHHSG